MGLRRECRSTFGAIFQDSEGLRRDDDERVACEGARGCCDPELTPARVMEPSGHAFSAEIFKDFKGAERSVSEHLGANIELSAARLTFTTAVFELRLPINRR
jgi:hypothetical protein